MNENAVDVCIIDDDGAQRALLSRQLLTHHFSVIESGSGEDGLDQLRQLHPHVVLCDLRLPGMDGITVCQHIRADPALDGTYFILLTVCDQREIKHAALNAGVDDYLLKTCDATELVARLRNGLRVSRLQERLRRAALSDGLTGLWNHTQFRHLLDREFARVCRYGGVVSLLMLDLDHFKTVNDTYGHETGNRVLKATAGHLLNIVRDIDLVARYGGEEFAISCPQTSLDDAVRLAERIRQTIPQEVHLPPGSQRPVTISVGVASTSGTAVTCVRDLIDQADQALYLAKREGRDRVVRADELPTPEPSAVLLATDVDRLQKQVLALSMQSRELCLQSVWALVQALEARDRYTAWHSRNTRFYVTGLAGHAGWPESLCGAVGTAAMLHDLGKIGVPDELLQKTDALSASEAATLRQVPLITCRILEPLRVFEAEILMIRHLRERYDGQGFPDHLVGPRIPIGSRLLAVAEAFDALTSGRAYRQPRSIEDAVAEIRAHAGTQFDPQFAELLAEVTRVQRDRWLDQIRRTTADARIEADASAGAAEL